MAIFKLHWEYFPFTGQESYSMINNFHWVPQRHLPCENVLLCTVESCMLPWIFIGRTDAEVPTLGPPDAELTHWKRPWCWERTGGEGDDRGWDGWMASPTQWTWVWVDSGSWWWTGKPGLLWFMGSQRVWHNWATELNWNWRDRLGVQRIGRLKLIAEETREV